MTHIEAMKQALEALESCTPEDTTTGHVIWPSYDEDAVEKAITSLRQAIATEESSATQEPVAWMRTSGTGSPVVTDELLIAMPEMRWNFQQPLYTHPQPKAEQPKVRTGDCLLVGVCASEGHKIQPKAEQEPVAYVNDQYSRDGYNDEISVLLPVGTPVYTHPQPKAEQDYKAISKQAYESGYLTGYMDGAIKAHEAKAPTEESSEAQEPVGYTDEHGNAYQYGYTGPKFAPNIQLYTHPQPQKPWVGLTDEEIAQFDVDPIEAKALIQKLKEKNTKSPIKWSDYENDGRIIKSYPEKDKS